MAENLMSVISRCFTAHSITVIAVFFLQLFPVTTQQYYNYLDIQPAANTPPYFNLARGRKIEASATCGEFNSYLEEQRGHLSCATPGGGLVISNNRGRTQLQQQQQARYRARGELYCKLTGANWAKKEEAEHSIREGQLCDCCYPGDPEHGHPAEYAIDGTEKWWQSPPLSRGYQYEQVNLTIDLGQIFHVAFIMIKMANTPRPEQWVLERSADFGVTWQPWQYFAGTARDCLDAFGVLANQTITSDDTVLCSTEFSKIVPLENGEILVSFVNGRPGANPFILSDSLRNWTTATHIRLRFQKIKTLMGQYVTRQNDESVTRRYYYSVKDIHIGGRCMCHGYTNTCYEPDSGSNVFYCDCKNNTGGQYCERCREGFVQKRWRPARFNEPFECEACNCNGHSDSCYYDPLIDEQRKSLDIHGNYDGGGVCTNCRDFTTGINCDLCEDGYYRQANVPANARQPCIPCPCNLRFTTGKCAMFTGKCECRPQFVGDDCDQCAVGYYGFPDCIPCPCWIYGTQNGACLPETGQCVCRPEFTGPRCDECAVGFFKANSTDITSGCIACQCDGTGSSDQVCNRLTGQCQCVDGYAGRQCNVPDDGYYRVAGQLLVIPCDCDTIGTTDQVCNQISGVCSCRLGYAGARCDVCAPGYSGYPNCTECDCDPTGTLPDSSCDIRSGQCQCKSNYGGRNCRQCRPGFYNYPSCSACECSVFGAIGTSCNNNGSCTCRPGFEGKKCDRCAALRYNYPRCEECNCNPAGVVAYSDCTTAQKEGELCECKARVEGRTCDRCKPLFFGLTAYNALGCEECGCFTAGTISALRTCAGGTGQCACKPYVGPNDRMLRIGSGSTVYNGNNGARKWRRDASSRPPPHPVAVNYKQLTGSGANARRCSVCRDRFYGLSNNDLLGCRPCKCDAGGSTFGGNCDKNSGKCKCRARITGDRCDRPISAAYVPSLHQLKFEAEDGRTREFHRTRFGFDDTKFPNHSWRGFANLSSFQPEVLIDVDLPKPGLYQILLRYVNPTAEQLKVNVQFGSENYVRQGSGANGQILLPAATTNESFDPQFAVVSHAGSPNMSQVFFVETRGTHVVALKLAPSSANAVEDKPVDSNAIEIEPSSPASAYAGNEMLYVDYVVLLPDAYYEARVLRQEVYDVCLDSAYVERNVMTQQQQVPCRKLAYPPLNNFFNVRNEAASSGDRGSTSDEQQNEVDFELPLAPNEPHVIIVEYFTSRPNSADILDVEFRSRRDTESAAGSLQVYECPYHMLCRSVITDPDGQAQLFTSPTGRGFIRLVSNSDENGAVITQLTVMPASNFSNDYVTPSTVCLHLNDRQLCEPVGLPEMPPGTTATIVEAEAENPFEVPLVNGQPLAGITIGATSLRSVDGTMSLSGRVSRPDKYTFVMQYMNPNIPTEEADVVVQTSDPNSATSAATTGVVKFDYCPSIAGCRALVQVHNGESNYNNNNNRNGGNAGGGWYVDDEFTITIEARPDADIWIDKLYVVPSERWKTMHMEELPVSVADRFVDACRSSFFDVSNTSSTANNDALCKEATFSLAAEYNNGALPCQCNIDGIENARFDCAPLGGQCTCKPNVIGRTCSRCRTGYFGFPQCRKCDCPYNALCDENTGQCLCPPGVTGQKCDRCKPNAYGFDPYIGCQPCDCNEFGVLDGQRDCDETTGQCRCKPNILSRTCSECAIGHYNFPECYECQCNLGGTLKTICNGQTGACYCKPFADGDSCERCKRGSYNLNANNPLGCTSCFCFGRSRHCESSNMFKTNVENLVFIGGNSSWQLQPSGTGSLALNEDNEVRNEPGGPVIVFRPDLQTPTQATFFNAPQQFLGNQLKSYGGKLRYTITPIPEVGTGNENIPTDPDLYDIVLVGGPNGVMRLVHYAAVQPSSGQSTEIVVPLLETAFNYSVQPDIASGFVTRENFMRTLANLTSLRIRATYFTNIKEVELTNFQLETAAGNNANGRLAQQYKARLQDFVNDTTLARAVEMCDCPPAYTGSSCEECADGYYYLPALTRGINISSQRLQQDGECVPCDCNGFSETCDKINGTCTNCRFNTVGDHCELCANGFYGDPKIFRGSPATCQPCACPFVEDVALSGSGRGRADGCQLGKHDVICNCREGYVGDRCEECAPTYYGNPGVPGGQCLPCQCNGNLDSNDPFACDPETGACLRCANNTAGQHCEQCAPGFYGSALDGGVCRPCECSVCGTEVCDNVTGECGCKPHVEGALCDRCEYAHYGLQTLCGNGCESCQCGVASTSKQCNETTGQCICQPGATGRTCSACKSGYYRLTQEGCSVCQCDSKYSKGTICDQQTGQCSCLPGVTGIGCDRCKYRHVLIGNVGCRSCPPCVHQLLDSTDDLEKTVAPAVEQFNISTSSFFIERRLAELGRRHQQAVGGLDRLDKSQAAYIVGSWNTDLGGIEDLLASQLGNAQSMVGAASRLRNRSGEDIKKTEQVRQSIVELYGKARETNRTIQNLERSLLHSGGIRLEDYVQNAEQWLDRIGQKNFDVAEDDADEELRQALLIQTDAENFNNTDREGRLLRLQKRFARLDARMQDARNLAKNTSKTTQQANEKSAFNDAQLADSIDYITLLASTIPAVTRNASEATGSASRLSELSVQDFEYSAARRQLLRTELENARRNMDAQKFDKGQLEELVLMNEDYVTNATRQLNEVAAKLNPVTQATRAAVTAASAYTNIQNNMVQARTLANEVVNTPQVDAIVVARQMGQADDMSQGIQRTWDTTMSLGPEITAEADRLARVVQGNLTQTRQQANEMQLLIQRLQDRIGRTRRTDLLPMAQNYDLAANSALKRANAARETIDELAAKVNQLRGEASVLVPKGGLNASSLSSARQNGDVSNGNGNGNGNDNGNLNGNGEALAATDLLNIVERSQELASNLRRVQGEQADKVDAARASMANIRAKISQARQYANRVPLGVEFGPSSKLQIKTPQNIHRTAMFTDLSMYFRTRAADGLLFYIGNEVGSGRRVRRDYNPVTDDYLTLQIVKGLVRLTYNLGEEDVDIQSDMFVANGEWYFVRVERTAQLAELVVQNSRGEISRTKGASRGLFSVLDLNPISSAIFAGGMPQEFGAQHSINAKHFIGCIDNIRLFDEPLGLWNFQGVTLARTTATPAQLGGCANSKAFASRISADDARATGVARFNGRGFARFNNTDLLTGDGGTKGMMLNFQLRTFQRDALIFWTGGSQDSSYISTFFKDGRIVLQFDLNMGVAQAVTRKTYNDGEWHSVVIELENRQGALNVDGGQSEYTEAEGDRNSVFQLDEPYIYVAGVEPAKQAAVDLTGIPARGFNGCLRNLEINGQRIDLSRPSLSDGMDRQCPDSLFFVRQISLNSTEAQDGGYLMLPSTTLQSNGGSANQPFSATLKFKTRQPNGVILTTGNAELSETLSLYLLDGRLFVAALKPGDDASTSPSVVKAASHSNRFHNGEWHYVTIVQDVDRLQMNVDDYEYVTERIGDAARIRQDVSGPLYLGGVPADNADALLPWQVLRNIENSFAGCIGDLTINKQPRNMFSETSENVNFGGECAITPVDEQWYVNQQQNLLASSADSDTVVSVPRISAQAGYEPPAGATVDAIRAAFQTSSTRTATTRRPSTTPTTTTTTTTTTARTTLPTIPPPIVIAQAAAIPPTTRTSTSTASTTTSTTTTTPTTPAFVDPNQCRAALSRVAIIPPNPTDMYREKGLLFGASSESRMEYYEPLSLDMLLRSGSFTFDLLTRSPNGVIFYADGGGAKSDFLAVYMENGFLVYTFNPGSGAAVIRSSRVVNDGKWHSVQANRTGVEGELYVDGVLEGSGSSRSANLQDVNLKHPFYVGGVARSNAARLNDVRQNLRTVNMPSGFWGLLRQLRLNGAELIAPTFFDIASADNAIARGVYFPPPSATAETDQFIAPLSTFEVGPSRTITFEMKPQTNTGLLMAVRAVDGPDAMVVSLIEGYLHVAVENGMGLVTAISKPATRAYFCDGKFHTVKVIKQRNVLSVMVDENPDLSALGIGSGSSTEANTNSALYIGGIDRQVAVGMSGLETMTSFVGCIGEVRIDEKLVDFSSVHAVSGRVMGFCPEF